MSLLETMEPIRSRPKLNLKPSSAGMVQIPAVPDVFSLAPDRRCPSSERSHRWRSPTSAQDQSPPRPPQQPPLPRTRSLQVDFQQARIADIKAAIRRIHIDDRFIVCGVVDPGEVWGGTDVLADVMCRKASAPNAARLISSSPDVKSMVSNRVELDGIEVAEEIDKDVITAAARQRVTVISADDGIVAVVAVDGVAAGFSVDRSVSTVTLDCIVA